MVGYAQDHTLDTYCLYNPGTGKIIESQNVSWSGWAPETIDLDKDADSFAAVQIHNIDEDDLIDLWDNLKDNLFNNATFLLKKVQQVVQQPVIKPNQQMKQPHAPPTTPQILNSNDLVPKVIDVQIDEANADDDLFGGDSLPSFV